MDIKSRIGELKRDVDQYINAYLEEQGANLARPGLKELARAIAYSAGDGGQRLRPILTIFTAEALGKTRDEVLGIATAVEFIHTYSLIHDDLPCMDDDDMRRGKPSSHKAFGEAMAVLAGDALNTEAFMVLVRAYGAQPQLAIDLVGELALSAGAQGMVGGQAVDVLFKDRDVDSAEIEFLHTYKTGALFRMSVMGAARVCGANTMQLKALSDYARSFGLLFQITDDISDSVDGLSTGRQRKTVIEPNFVKVVGLEGAHQTCQQLVARAQAVTEIFGARAEGLNSLVSYLYERISK